MRILIAVFIMLTVSGCKEDSSRYNSGNVYDNQEFAELTAKKQLEQEPKNINMAKLRMAQVDLSVPNTTIADDLPVSKQSR